VIKAIETQYKGYRFRSRLEARWAVFFDALRLRWDFEPEGFELGAGVRYLPDFRLHGAWFGCDVYAEVKPGPGSTEQDWKKAKMLSHHYPVLLLAGPPNVDRSDTLCLPQFWADQLGEDCFQWQSPAIERVSAQIFFTDGALQMRTLCGGRKTSEAAFRAVHAARRARFEHGESGARA
jgi:hypothetical protein